jgi:hypothetical protein
MKVSPEDAPGRALSIDGSCGSTKVMKLVAPLLAGFARSGN